MAEPTTPIRENTDAELIRLREENLRLRDQLIARDAEVGLMRGQVTELEAGAVRALHMLRRVKAILLPGAAMRIVARLRRLAKRG